MQGQMETARHRTGTGGGERRCSPKAEAGVLYQRVPNAVFLLCFCSQDTHRLCGKVAPAVTQHPALVCVRAVPWSPAPAPRPACSSSAQPGSLLWPCHSSAQGPSLALLLPAELCLSISALRFCQTSVLCCASGWVPTLHILFNDLFF